MIDPMGPRREPNEERQMVRKLIQVIEVVFMRMGSRHFAGGSTHGGQRSALGSVMVASQHFFEAGAELRHSY